MILDSFTECMVVLFLINFKTTIDEIEKNSSIQKRAIYFLHNRSFQNFMFISPR